jgi:hypothetical protein
LAEALGDQLLDLQDGERLHQVPGELESSPFSGSGSDAHGDDRQVGAFEAKGSQELARASRSRFHDQQIDLGSMWPLVVQRDGLVTESLQDHLEELADIRVSFFDEYARHATIVGNVGSDF